MPWPVPDRDKEVPMTPCPSPVHTGDGVAHLPPRRLLHGAVAIALLLLALSGITAAAQAPAGCIPISQTACFANGITYTSNPNALYSNATVNTAVTTAATVPTTAAYTPTYASYTAPTTASTGYPPNAVISTYFDPRYCGDWAVSVVTDQYGNLIDICSSSGVRIYPVYADYGYGYPVGYANGYYSGACPVGNYSCLRAQGYYGP
jgi:hypothetical protein